MWHLWCAPHWWAGHFQILLHWLFPRAPKMVSALLYQWGSYVPRSQRWYSGEARLESERFNFKTLAPSFILQPASQDGKEDGCAEKISAASARGPRKGCDGTLSIHTAYLYHSTSCSWKFFPPVLRGPKWPWSASTKLPNWAYSRDMPTKPFLRLALRARSENRARAGLKDMLPYILIKCQWDRDISSGKTLPLL